MKIVVVSPHRDDAAFSLGLAIECWLAQGYGVDILNCFTRSDYAPFSDAASLHINDRMSYVSALRRREDEHWRRLTGAPLTFSDLNLKDAPLRLHCSPDEVCTLSVRPEEKGWVKVRTAVSQRTGPLVLPLAIGEHVDHSTARAAGLAALEAGAGRASEAQPPRPVAFYEDLPYEARDGAVSAEDWVGSLAESLGTKLTPFFAGPTIDPDHAVAKKRRIVLCYDSQLGDDAVVRIAEFARHYGGRERLWANPAWHQAFGEQSR